MSSGIVKNFFSPLGKIIIKIAGWRRLNWSFLSFLTWLYSFLHFTRVALRSGKNSTAFPLYMMSPRSWYFSKRMRMGLGRWSAGGQDVGDQCARSIIRGSAKCSCPSMERIQKRTGSNSSLPSRRLTMLGSRRLTVVTSAMILQLVNFIYQKYLFLAQLKDTGVSFRELVILWYQAASFQFMLDSRHHVWLLTCLTYCHFRQILKLFSRSQVHVATSKWSWR